MSCASYDLPVASKAMASSKNTTAPSGPWIEHSYGGSSGDETAACQANRENRVQYTCLRVLGTSPLQQRG